MTVPQAEPSSRSSSPFADVPVLLVEDDEVLANVVAGALRSRGYPVDIVGTGGEALDRVSATEPKVVVLDRHTEQAAAPAAPPARLARPGSSRTQMPVTRS